MKEYTVIYAEYFETGSITRYRYITCLKEDLDKVIEEEIGLLRCFFVFQGHCKLEGE